MCRLVRDLIHIYIYINKDIHIYNNLRLTVMLAIIAHIHILYIYTNACTCIKTRPFTVGRLTFACEAIGTSFICLKDVERRCERHRDSWCFA